VKKKVSEFLYPMSKCKEPIGVVVLTGHPPEFRDLTKEQAKEYNDKLRALIKKWNSKEGVRLFGIYMPVLGTTWSTMEFWEFPDFDSIIGFRREFMDQCGRYSFVKLLIGKIHG